MVVHSVELGMQKQTRGFGRAGGRNFAWMNLRRLHYIQTDDVKVVSVHWRKFN